MKNIFYFIVSFILFIFILGLSDYFHDHPEKIMTDDKFNESIVIEKTDDWISRTIILYYYEIDTIIEYRVYQILYEKYDIGDTIKK